MIAGLRQQNWQRWVNGAGALFLALFMLNVISGSAGVKPEQRPLALLVWLRDVSVVWFMNTFGELLGRLLRWLGHFAADEIVTGSVVSVASLVATPLTAVWVWWTSFAAAVGIRGDMQMFMVVFLACALVGSLTWAIVKVYTDAVVRDHRKLAVPLEKKRD